MYSVPQQMMEESSGKFTDRVSKMNNCDIRQSPAGSIKTAQGIFKETWKEQWLLIRMNYKYPLT